MSIKEIFPTQIGIYSLSQCGIDNLPDTNSYLEGSDVTSESIRKQFHGQNILDQPEFCDLKYFILDSGKHFFINTFGCTNPIMLTNSWLNIGHKTSSQPLHNHSNSTISGTFYFSFDSVLHPSIVFKNPRESGSFSTVEDFSILSTQFNSSFYRPTYKEYDLLLWPSYLHHGFFATCEPSTTDKPRISLSFNMCIERTLLHPYKIFRK